MIYVLGQLLNQRSGCHPTHQELQHLMSVIFLQLCRYYQAVWASLALTETYWCNNPYNLAVNKHGLAANSPYMTR